MALTPKEEIRKAMLEAERRGRQEEAEGIHRKRDVISALSRQINAIKRSLPPEVNFVEVLFVLMAALSNDILDWLFIGSLPIIGDILDLATWIVILSWIWWRGFKGPPAHFLAGLVEFVPFLDILPVWTFYVTGIIIYNEARRAMQIKKIRKMRALGKQAREAAEAPA